MAINKVEFDGQTLIDLTGDTVTQQDVLNGKSFHTPDGVQRSGTASIPVSDVTVDGTSVVTNSVAVVASDNLAPTVTEASSRTNLAVGDSLKTIISKIKKFFSDLKTVAFTGAYSDLSGTPTNLNQFTNGPGYITSSGSCAYATSAGSATDSTKVAKAGDTMTGTLNMQTENNVCINLRPGNAEWYDTISTQTSGNEAVVFATKKGETSWIFVNGEDSVTNHANNRWQSLTPALQIKSNCVAIGKLIANATTPTYKLDVEGISMFTSGNDTPVRIKTTTTAKCYLGFYNNSALLGYYAVGTDKKPYFEPGGGSDARIALLSEVPTNNNQLTNGAGYITSSGSCASAASATNATNANYLSYQYGNEINFKGGKQATVWINYRDANTGEMSGGSTAINYMFANYNKYTSYTTITAANFSGLASKATADADGNTISSTYLKKSGGDMTGSVNFKSGKGINFYNSANNNYSDIYTADAGTTFLRSSHGYINLCTNNQAQVRNFGDTAWKNIAAANISSSRRFKEHIEDMTEEEAKKLLDVRTVTFDFKKEYEPSEDWHECKHQPGVIAEEVLDIYPTLVRFSNYEEPEKDPVPTFVEYSHFVPYLIKMVQMQQKEIDELKAIIKGDKS